MQEKFKQLIRQWKNFNTTCRTTYRIVTGDGNQDLHEFEPCEKALQNIRELSTSPELKSKHNIRIHDMSVHVTISDPRYVYVFGGGGSRREPERLDRLYPRLTLFQTQEVLENLCNEPESIRPD